VAIADGLRMPYVRVDDFGERAVMRDDGVGDHGRNPDVPFRPSTEWADAGPIIEREHIAIEYCAGLWWALFADSFSGNCEPPGPVLTGPTPLTAAMRAYVTSKFGDTVDLPA